MLVDVPCPERSPYLGGGGGGVWLTGALAGLDSQASLVGIVSLVGSLHAQLAGIDVLPLLLLHGAGIGVTEHVLHHHIGAG